MNSWKQLIIGLLVGYIIISSVFYQPAYSQDPALKVVEIAKQFLRDNASKYSLQTDLSTLKFLETVSSLGADHVRFQQLYQGITVYGNYVSVSVSKNGARAPQVTNGYDGSISLPSIVAKISADDASANARTSVLLKEELRGPVATELIIYPQGMSGKYRRYILAWKVKIRSREPPGDWEVFIDATAGQTLAKFNRLVSSQSLSQTPLLDRKSADIFSAVKPAIWKMIAPVIDIIRGATQQMRQ
ncbi:hypothetical protein HY214_03265 [Candidatus Roizmanbacteria bacterium]|nr:hypothetical protein [Candidatus Roizmanbacteria bacterium]